VKDLTNDTLSPSVKILTAPKTESLRRSTLKFSQIEGSFAAMMIGSSETFAFYYAVKRDVTQEELALISTVPVLLGAIANWIVPYFTKHRFLKSGVMACVFIQILGLIGLFTSIYSRQPFSIIFISLTLYWIGGLTASPLWIDWISHWLPFGRLGRYLSRRNGFIAMMTVATYLLAAALLFRTDGLAIFRIVFAFAIFCRTVSLVMLLLQPSAPARKPVRESMTPLKKMLSSRKIMGVIFFTSIFRMTSNIATPFFVPYMANQLKFNLMTFAYLSAVPFFGRMLFLPRWGETLRSHSPLIGLQLSMIMISLVCLIWSLATHLGILSMIEFISGISWGGFELITVLMLQEFLPGDARGIIGLHICFLNLAATLGALLGSAFLEANVAWRELFQISAALRLSVVLLFIVVTLKYSRKKIFFSDYTNFIKNLTHWRRN
jgi:MFS family permease